jgi:hypothetical protein
MPKLSFGKISLIDASTGAINKEFIPVFMLICSPMVSLMRGFGIKMFFLKVDLYYMLPVMLALFMNWRGKIKMTAIFMFLLLFVLDILVSLPYMHVEKYFNGDFVRLALSYFTILLYWGIMAASFWSNNPYFVSYYSTTNGSYLFLYRVIAVFLCGVMIFHLILFSQIYLILVHMIQ